MSFDFIITQNGELSNKHGFGRVPDPPEPEELECMEDCSLCVWKEVHKDGRYICNDVNGEGFIEKEEM